MATQQITIDGANGVYNVFKDRRRWTIYEYIGTFRGEINESSVLLRLIADNEVRLVGFAVAPDITNNPYIGGFENEQPKPEQPIEPSRPGGMFPLHILPCIDQKSDIFLLDESLTQKGPDTVEFQILTHSLTYNKGYADQSLLAKCSYTITGEDGKIYVSVIQKEGAKSLQLGGDCGNNHPRFEDNVPGLGKYDCKVYLPKQDYWVDMNNTGLCPITPWVHHPHTHDGENRDIYKGNLERGNKDSIFISKNEFNGEDYRNAVKINANC
jgi:hypothetical protein